MPSQLSDILILGLLAVLFLSIYCTRASRRLRFWIVGWLSVLLHFAAMLLHPASAAGQNAIFAGSIGALALAGFFFLLSATPKDSDGPHDPAISRRRRLARSGLGALLPLCTLTLIVCTVYAPGPRWPLYLCAGLGEPAALWLLWVASRGRRRVRPALMLCGGLCTVWLAYALRRQQADASLCAILTEIFSAFAGLYWIDFRRRSAGVLTAVLGLLAWASVFPASLLAAWLWPALSIPGELWNLPKFFVAFGMILTLLEEEIAVAEQARNQYQLLFDANPHPMWIYERSSLRFLKVNDAAVEHYGYSREEFLVRTLADIRPAEDWPALRRATAQSSDSSILSGPWRHCKRDGTVIQVDLASHSIEFDGRDCRFVLVQDVTERQQLHEKLVHQAHHDSLTALPNRLLLQDRMEQALLQAGRNGRHAAILCLDLDRFKQINDTYGHAAGDRCLQHVAARLRERLRASDTVARTGGEEFTVLLGQLDEPGDAALVAQELLEGIGQAMVVDDCALEVSASMGIAIFPDHATEPASLWRMADMAMYRAKAAGGNRYCFVSRDLSNTAQEDQEIERALQRLLSEASFSLLYQPQHTGDGRLCGFEASLALELPGGRTIPPQRVAAVAEQSDAVLLLGQAVLARACSNMVHWRRVGLDPMRVAISVSPRQFLRSDFAAYVIETLTAQSIEPSLFEFEVTEAALMRNHSGIAHQMRTLAEFGVRFSVEDFGTGYSSLGHLQQLPITTLKVDRSFIEHVAQGKGANSGTGSLVQAIISLAHSLGLQVLADGVETERQLRRLRQLRCDYLQGPLFSPPLPERAVADALALARGLVS